MVDDLFLPLDFSAIVGYPHDLPEKAIDKLPIFRGNNVVSARSHVRAFGTLLSRWARQPHEDMKMKLFALSLEGDAFDWFCDLLDNSYKTLKDLHEGFLEKWGERKESRHFLAALSSIKRNENETVEEFNKRFNDLVASLHKDVCPPPTAILIHFIEAFSSEISYQLRDKRPTDLKDAQKKVVTIDKI